MAEISTKHLIVDLKSGFIYGIKLDAEGNCTAVQAYNNMVKTIDTGREIREFGPLLNVNDNPLTQLSAEPAGALPYGKTTYAVELHNDNSKGQIFTIVWPTKEEANIGKFPIVAKKDLSDDLSAIAPAPKGVKGARGAGLDDAETLKGALGNIEAMIGLDTAKTDIKQSIAIARFNRVKEEMGLSTKPISRHMVFTGNPGTGKTTFAREVAKVYHALGFIGTPNVHEVKREDLVAGFVGQTALKTTAAIEKAIGIERDDKGKIIDTGKPKGGILFIDEAYALARDGSSDSKDFGREAIDTLVAAMENMRENLIVIVAGYTEPMKGFIDANPGLKSRFMTYINFEDYNMSQLSQIMDFMLKDRGYVMTPEAKEHSIRLIEEEQARSRADFGNGRTVRNLVEKAEKELALRLENEHKLGKNHGLTMDELKVELTTITLADVKAVSLQGINKSKAGMKFGQAAGRKPLNDNAHPAAVEAFPMAQSRKHPSGPSMRP